MSRLTLRLPETLHQQLAQVAEREGVSLNQYIVYALTRQTSAISQLQGVNIDLGSPQFEREVERQQSLFVGLKERLGEVSSTDVAACNSRRARSSKFRTRINDRDDRSIAEKNHSSQTVALPIEISWRFDLIFNSCTSNSANKLFLT